jgi:hypothetical protein
MNATTPALPQIVTAADFAKRGKPGETIVRVILRQPTNSGVYRLRCGHRSYLAVRNDAVCAHVIDVPESVWNAGIPEGKPYVKNDSVAADITGRVHALKIPLIVHTIPGKPPEPAAPMPEAEKATPLVAFRKLAEATGAPPVIMQAVELLLSDLQPAEIETALMESITHVEASRAPAVQEESSHSASLPSEVPAKPAAKKAGKSNAERQREFRAKKRAEKEAAKAAASQGF